jgi:hypothetical protein
MKSDVILPQIPTNITPEQKSFYEGVLNVIKDLRTELNSKPDWIPVTYLNNWVDYDSNFKSTYYKDILGYVHLTVGCKSGSTLTPFVMPEGYRPEKVILEFIDSQSSVTNWVPILQIGTDGTVYFGYYTNTLCIRSEIIYRAA